MPPLGIPLRMRGVAEPVYIRLDINSMTRIEDAADEGLADILGARKTVSALRWVIWAGARIGATDKWRGLAPLAPGEEPWTPDAAGNLLQSHLDHGGTLEQLLEDTKAATDAAIGTEEPSGPPPGTPAPVPPPASDSATG